MSEFKHPDGSADGGAGDEVPILWYAEPTAPGPPTGRPPTRTLLFAFVAVVVLAVVVAAVVRSTGSGGKEAAAETASSASVTTSAADSAEPSTASSSTAESASPTTTERPDFSSASSSVSPSLVRVVASTCQGTGSGTGFWIDDETVLTSYQSVSQNVSVVVVDKKNKPWPAEVYGADPVHGVALLYVPGADGGPALKLSSTSPDVQDWVAVVGFKSMSDDITTDDDQVTESGIGFKHHGLPMRNYEALPGALDLSLGGAPVVSAEGSVEGIVFAVTAQPRRLFVPADQVRQGIETAESSGAPKRGHCKMPTGPYSQTRITGHPSPAMRRGLTTYFAAINSANYDKAFYEGMGPDLQAYFSWVPPAKGWVSSYDFNINVHKPTSATKAWVTFDSIFAKGRGPKGVTTCARWSSDYRFVKVDGDLLVNHTSPHHGKLSYKSC